MAESHLTDDELACKDSTPYPAEWADRLESLREAFEYIRHKCGDKPITILSAYRTQEHNRRVNGAANSQHCEGRALDLKPPDGYDVRSFYIICQDAAHHTAIRGIGYYPKSGFVHIDIRPSAVIRYWWEGPNHPPADDSMEPLATPV